MNVDTIGACRRCLSATDLAGTLHCTDPHVCDRGRAVPCEEARRPHRACGPEAMRLHWPAIGVVPDDRLPALRLAA